METRRPPLPVTVIGGYLGAGKTTLVNHFLRHADGVRLAVLVNEFGELPIDADLIEAEDEDVIAIAGGCVCCSYGNDLTLALMDLAKLDPRPDHVLIEASGVAIPGAIVAALGLLADYEPDATVILADAETIRAGAADRFVGDTVLRQLGDADLVLLNKTDLVSGEAATAVADWLVGHAPGARVLPTVEARIPLAAALGAGLERRGDAPPPAPHAASFETAAFRPAGPVDAEALARDLATGGYGIVRAKGFVTDLDGARRRLQIVGARWRVDPAAEAGPDGLVVIGLKGGPDSAGADFDGEGATGLKTAAIASSFR